jgi:hypothetical protein
MSFFELFFSITAHLMAATSIVVMLAFIHSVFVEFTTPESTKKLCASFGKDYGGLDNVSFYRVLLWVIILISSVSYLLTEVYGVF